MCVWPRDRASERRLSRQRRVLHEPNLLEQKNTHWSADSLRSLSSYESNIARSSIIDAMIKNDWLLFFFFFFFRYPSPNLPSISSFTFTHWTEQTMMMDNPAHHLAPVVQLTPPIQQQKAPGELENFLTIRLLMQGKVSWPSRILFRHRTNDRSV